MKINKNNLIKANQEVWGFREEWDTPKSYAAFCLYRDLGSQRSVEAIAPQVGKTVSLLWKWCKQGNWVERADAYDIHMDELSRDLAIKEATSEHIEKLHRYRNFCENLGWANLDLAADCLDVSRKALQNFKEDPGLELKPFEVKALSSAGVSSAEIGQRLLSEALAVGKLLETLPIDVESVEVNEE